MSRNYPKKQINSFKPAILSALSAGSDLVLKFSDLAMITECYFARDVYWMYAETNFTTAFE